MKERKYLTFASVAVLLTTVSCYKDLSTEATFEIPPIEVTSPEYPGETLTIKYGQYLDVSLSVVQEGRTESDFSYFWEIDLVAGKAQNRIELGEESSVHYQVANSPSDEPYMLSVRVTDGKTGYSVYRSWKVYVTSSLGEGLLVAHTSDSGATTELDLLSCSPVTYGYSGSTPTYTRNLFAMANSGTGIEGRVNAMTARVACDGALFNESRIIIGTDRGIFSLDPLTYKVARRDRELFNIVEESSFATTALFNFAAYQSGAIVNGRLYNVICNSDNSYSKVSFSGTPSDIFKASNTAYAKLDKSIIAVFDETRSRFFYIYGWQAFTATMTLLENQPDYPSGTVCLGCGCLTGSALCFVLRYPDGKLKACVLTPTDTGPLYSDYDLTIPEIDSVVDFAFCDNAMLFYCVTPEKIYPVTIVGSGAVTGNALAWSPEKSSEKITSIEQYKQGWYGTHQYDTGDYSFPLSTNRAQIVITTWDASTAEGKIYLHPFSAQTGRFTSKNNGVYGGFGQITAIASTLK